LHRFLSFAIDHIRSIPGDVYDDKAPDSAWREHMQSLGMNEKAIDSVIPWEEDPRIYWDFMHIATAAGDAAQGLESSFMVLERLDKDI